VWAKNLRTAGRKLAELEARREQGLPLGSTTGALTEERRDALEAIDPSWCPAWPVAWQRAYVLCRRLIEAGAPLPKLGETTVQGEDLGAWVQAQRLDWDTLLPAQQWMLEMMLNIGPAEPSERPQAAPTQADKWAANLAAARQFHAREGHLQPPRKNVEIVDGTEHKLGMFVDNSRRRAGKLSAERRAELTALGMRW
jgi:Helicase associated domain